VIKDRPRRLNRIFSRAPLFFVTFCTRNRQKIDYLDRVTAAFVTYGARAAEKCNIAVGRYVIMPDHVHFFVRGDPDFVLSPWIGGLKRAMAVAVFKHSQAQPLSKPSRPKKDSQATRLPLQARSLWQPGFFDHVLRNDESYAQKWEYIRDNPVRAGLVAQWYQWPYQGEIVLIDRA
jgi:REP element-mobilizing transposase RayT